MKQRKVIPHVTWETETQTNKKLTYTK